jgi:hypothetical protein
VCPAYFTRQQKDQHAQITARRGRKSRVCSLAGRQQQIKQQKSIAKLLSGRGRQCFDDGNIL